MSNKKLYIGLGAFLLLALAGLLATSDNVHAFSMPWSSTTAEEHYTMAVENENALLIQLKAARLQRLNAQGDLAFKKSEQASKDHNMEELLRLTGVINKINVEINQIQNGELTLRFGK